MINTKILSAFILSYCLYSTAMVPIFSNIQGVNQDNFDHPVSINSDSKRGSLNALLFIINKITVDKYWKMFYEQETILDFS